MKKNWFFILVIIFLTLLAWHPIYNHSFLGEGYVYFSDNIQLSVFSPQGNIKKHLFRDDNLACWLYYFFEIMFVDNLKPFMIFLLMTLVGLNLCFYFMVNELTKNRIVAFMASIFLGVNYITTYGMVGIGYYQWVAQRVPNFIFAFISFFFYLKFLALKKYFFYFLSLIFFFFSVLTAHFSFFFLPIFIFYTSFSVLFKEKFREKWLIRIIELAPFIFWSQFLLSKNRFMAGKENLLIFVLKEKWLLIRTITHQITMVTIPFNLWPFLEKFIRKPMEIIIPGLYLPTLLFYVVSIIYMFKKKKEWAIVLLSCAFSLISVSILNVYMKRPLIVFKSINSNRYFFTLGFFASLYLAIFFYFFLYKKNMITRLILIIFLFSWVFQNTKMIWFKMEKNQYKHDINLATQAFIKRNYLEFENDAFVIVPSAIGAHGINFYKKFYGEKTTRFVSINSFVKWEDVSGFNPQKDFILGYNYESEQIVNRSGDYKEIFKDKKLLDLHKELLW